MTRFGTRDTILQISLSYLIVCMFVYLVLMDFTITCSAGALNYTELSNKPKNMS